MAGVQKLFYLPEPHTDFIFAVIGEELGLIGATGILVCFCVIAWRGLRIAMRAEDTFGSFVALGLTTMIAVQAFVNMSVVLGLVIVVAAFTVIATLIMVTAVSVIVVGTLASNRRQAKQG